MTRSSTRARRAVFGAITLIILLLVLEALSFVGIVVLARVADEEIRRTVDIFQEQAQMLERLLERPQRLQLDSELGWRYRAGYSDPQDQVNTQGLRSAREYGPVPNPGAIRVAAFGDSFVYCMEVSNEDSWPTLMEATFADMEVLNYGIGGYGTDQAYLRYLREGSSLSPEVVIIGFAPVNLSRAVNVYRRFVDHRELPLAKPRFALGPDGGLVLLPNPLRTASDYEKYRRDPPSITELGRYDHWYRPAVYENPLYDYSATVRVGVTAWLKVYDRYLDPDRLSSGNVFNRLSTAFRIQTAVLEKFAAAVQASGATPVVVIFPDRDSIAGARRGGPKVFDPLAEHMRRAGINLVDLTDAFVAERTDDVAAWFAPGGHYSPLGNRVAAATLGRYIVDLAQGERSVLTRKTARSADAPGE